MTGKYLFAQDSKTMCLKLAGEIRYTSGPEFDTFLDSILRQDCCDEFIIDLTDTLYIDSTNLGLLAKISRFMEKHLRKQPIIFSTHKDITKLLLSVGFDKAFHIVNSQGKMDRRFTEISTGAGSDCRLAETMLKAHQTLMDLSAKNKAAFKNVVELLKKNH